MRYVGLGKNNARSHFVFRPRHAPEWLRTRFLPVVFLANEELTGKTFTTFFNTTKPNTYVKVIFPRASPLITLAGQPFFFTSVGEGGGHKVPPCKNAVPHLRIYSSDYFSEFESLSKIESSEVNLVSMETMICFSRWFLVFRLWTGITYHPGFKNQRICFLSWR